jgi:SET domain-containing protein
MGPARVQVGGERKIAIYTLRRVEAGEELAYDYKMSNVEGAERIPCGCGARHCKGFMN